MNSDSYPMGISKESELPPKPLLYTSDLQLGAHGPHPAHQSFLSAAQNIENVHIECYSPMEATQSQSLTILD